MVYADTRLLTKAEKQRRAREELFVQAVKAGLIGALVLAAAGLVRFVSGADYEQSLLLALFAWACWSAAKPKRVR